MRTCASKTLILRNFQSHALILPVEAQLLVLQPGETVLPEIKKEPFKRLLYAT